MTYVVQNVGTTTQSKPKSLVGIGIDEQKNNWVINQIDFVDDSVIDGYRGNTAVWSIIAGPNLLNVLPMVLTTAPIAALATVGAAVLSTTQLYALTSTQLSTLCTNNDLMAQLLHSSGFTK